MATLPAHVPAPALEWRPLREGDIAYVAALEAQIHAAPWTVGNFHDALAAGYSARIGERECRIVAYGVLMLAPGEAQGGGRRVHPFHMAQHTPHQLGLTDVAHLEHYALAL